METSLKLAVNSMTEQELFDTISVRLLAQGCSSMSSAFDTCAYSGDNGLRCAVGLIMSEEELEKVRSTANYFLNIAGIFTVYSVLYLDGEDSINSEYNPRLRFLAKFQQVHDACNVRDLTDADLWRSKVAGGLCKIALKHGLDESVLTA